MLEAGYDLDTICYRMTSHGFHLRLLALARRDLAKYQRESDAVALGIGQVLGKDTRSKIGKIIESHSETLRAEMAQMVNRRELSAPPTDAAIAQAETFRRQERHMISSARAERTSEQVQTDIRELDRAMSLGAGKHVRNPIAGYDGSPGIYAGPVQAPTVIEGSGMSPAQLAGAMSAQQR